MSLISNLTTWIFQGEILTRNKNRHQTHHAGTANAFDRPRCDHEAHAGTQPAELVSALIAYNLRTV